MRRLCLIIGFVAFWASASAQLNVELLHQLVAESKSEHERQSDARNNQTLTTGNEAVNKTSLTRLKEKYRDIQSRFKTLGLAISAAQIGIEAYPLVSDIITQQGIIFVELQQKSRDLFMQLLFFPYLYPARLVPEFYNPMLNASSFCCTTPRCNRISRVWPGLWFQTWYGIPIPSSRS